MQEFQNKEYLNLVDDILNNKVFSRLSNYKHHGGNRKEHCIRVSYYSYKLAKKLNLDYKQVARAGLLHDFFLVDYKHACFKEKVGLLFNHSKIALDNSKKFFKISKKEQNIIVSHMFPIRLFYPKSRESILVNFVDKSLAIYERFISIKNALNIHIRNNSYLEVNSIIKNY